MLKPADKGFCLTSHAMSLLWRDSLGSASCSLRIAASPFSRIYHFRAFPGPTKQTSTADRVRLPGEGQALRSTSPSSCQGSGPPEGLERGGSSGSLSLCTQRSWTKPSGCELLSEVGSPWVGDIMTSRLCREEQASYFTK